LLFILPVLWSSVLAASRIENAINTRDIADAITADWRITAATTALKMGLSSRAIILYEEYMSHAPDPQVVEIKINLAIAYLQMGKNSDARDILKAIPTEFAGARDLLYLLIAEYRIDKNVPMDTVAERLTKLDVTELHASDLPWYYLLLALAAEQRGDLEAVSDSLSRARDMATESGQKILFEALIMREEMRRVMLDETQLIHLLTHLQAVSGETAAFPFVRQYVIALHAAGRSVDAIKAIDQQLGMTTNFGVREREQLLLLKGMILGVDTADGRAAFRELIRNGNDRETLLVALQLLAMQSPPNTPESANLASFLDELVIRSEPHPLLGEVYLLRAQLSLERNDIALAEEDAKRLLERFPGLESIHRAYHILGLAALRKEPPQYRTAANFFQQFRDASEQALLRQQLAILIGDCYFLNLDFENAAEFYRLAWQGTDSNEPLPPIFLRLISAHIRANAIDQALEWIDNPLVRERISSAALWRAEWNLARFLSANQRAEQALQRIESHIAAIPAADEGLNSLRLRLLWLKTRLDQSLNDGKNAPQYLQQLLDGIAAMAASEDKDTLQGEALLLQSEILLKNAEWEKGREVLASLRTQFANSPPAERSYFTEAAQLVGNGEINSAQERLLEFAQATPQSRLAAQALFDSAILAQQLGPELYREALQRLDRLSEQYPDSPLVFVARLRQGDLLRRLGDFSSAQSVYETLLGRFSDHPLRYAAELGRADSLLALSRNVPGALAEIGEIYERMLDLPTLSPSIRAEILYKQAHTLMQRDLIDAAIKVLMRMVGTYLNFETDRSLFEKLDENGRYWLARGLMDLGGLLETQGNLNEAQRIYLTIATLSLPGRQLARNRAEAIRNTLNGG
jgi:TolA-binding protein